MKLIGEIQAESEPSIGLDVFPSGFVVSEKEAVLAKKVALDPVLLDRLFQDLNAARGHFPKVARALLAEAADGWESSSSLSA